ncbi:hypothetical protein [Alteromonas macleodii]
MGNGVTVKNTASVSQRDVVDSLTKQLAKANERVKELEAQTFDVIAAQSIEQAYQIASSFPKDKAILEALSAVKEGATNRLNKFAIEKKVEALEDVLQSYVPAKFHPTTYAIQAFNDGVSHLFAHIQERIEQLHKEQEHV